MGGAGDDNYWFDADTPLDADQIIEVLEASVPPGANIGELILHADADLTVLYGRVPPRFQSAIHNHTIFACIGALRGDEENTFYERAEDGAGLRQVRTTRVKAGRVIGLPSDVIHSIANPGDDTGRALHIYGGDFGAVMGERSLWSADTHEEIPFSFEGLVKESIKTMKRDDNEAGLRAIARATSRAMTFPDPSQIAFRGDSRNSRGIRPNSLSQSCLPRSWIRARVFSCATTTSASPAERRQASSGSISARPNALVAVTSAACGRPGGVRLSSSE